MKKLFATATPHYAWIQASYWMAYCILFSFSSLYLLDRGLTNGEIGLLLGLAGALASLLQPWVGARGDRLRRLSLGQFAGALVAAMGLCAVGLLLFPGKGAQAGLYLGLLVLPHLLAPLLYALGMDCVNNQVPLNFGLARGMGGMSFALVSGLCGWVTALAGPGVIPVLLLLAGGMLGVGAATFRRGGPVGRNLPKAPPPPADRRPFLKKYPQCRPLLAGAVLVCTSHNVLASFCLQIVQPLGGGSGEMGWVLTLQGIMDIPAMVLFALLLRRARARVWVRLAGVSFFLHALLSWAAPNLPFLYAIQVFEMTGYAVYAVASVYLVNDLVDLCDRVQGQTYFNMANTLGIVASSFAGGFLLDLAGPQAALALAALTGAGGMGLLWVCLGRRAEVAEPQHG